MFKTTKILASLLLCICLLTLTCSSDENQGNTRSVKVSMSMNARYFDGSGYNTRHLMILVDGEEEILDQIEMIPDQKLSVESNKLSEHEVVSFYLINEDISHQGVGKNLHIVKFTNIDGHIDIDGPEWLPGNYRLIILDNILKDEIERCTDNVNYVTDAGDDKSALNFYIKKGRNKFYCAIKKKEDPLERYIWIEDAPFDTDLHFDFNELPVVSKEQSIQFPEVAYDKPSVELVAYNDGDYHHGHTIISTNSGNEVKLNQGALEFNLDEEKFDEFYVDLTYFNSVNIYQNVYFGSSIEDAVVSPDMDFEIIKHDTEGISYQTKSDCDFYRSWISTNHYNNYLQLTYLVYGLAEQEGEIPLSRKIIDEYTKDHPNFNYEEEMIYKHLRLSRSVDGKDIENFLKRELLFQYPKPLHWEQSVARRY